MVSYVIPIDAMIIGALNGENISGISLTQALANIGIISMVSLVQRNTQV